VVKAAGGSIYFSSLFALVTEWNAYCIYSVGSHNVIVFKSFLGKLGKSETWPPVCGRLVKAPGRG
jgi:hypothetical protein